MRHLTAAFLSLVLCAGCIVAQEAPRAAATTFGQPVRPALPEKLRREMEDQGVALSRLRLYFDAQGKPEDGISLEFEDQRTEIPVVYAAFRPEGCDRELAYSTWNTRDGHYVDLSFDVKTLPARLPGLKVQIEHLHLRGTAETLLATFDAAAPDAGEPWESMRLRGARPGLNRYRLVVSYTNSKGETVRQPAFSHWVTVQAPPMFEFSPSLSGSATHRKAAGQDVLTGDVRMESSFLLHEGLDPAQCHLRVVRRGSRELNLTALDTDLRRVVEKERIPPGWQEVGRVALNGGTMPGLDTLKVEDALVKFVFRHNLSATGATLPLKERWEYRFELLHADAAEPLAAWNAEVSADVPSVAAIAASRIKAKADGVAQPLEIALTRK
ncbi:MAG: hypothetical protein IT463_11100 [Planctomycetes bacterium]|nr:hypothetical protein [Planctomycetota bacterium]